MIGRKQVAERCPEVTLGGMRIRLLPTDAHLAGGLWQQIERQVGSGGLTCSWAWTETWLRHYGDLIPHRFVVGEKQGPCAIALITEGVGQYRGPFPVRTVHLGTAGEPDADTVRVEYNRLLVDPADRDAFLVGTIGLVAESGLRCDELQLDGFPPDEVATLLNRESGFVADRRVCHVADLRSIRDAGGTVLGSLRSHTASKIRRSIRRLEEAHGPLRVEWAESREQGRHIFDEMLALHKARWEAVGSAGSFASPRSLGFHRDIVDRLFTQGGIVLTRVSAGEQTIGCDYGFVERNRVLSYQWGLAHFEDKRLSPGIVTGATVMQAALERGLDEYDWLAGDVLYKRELSTTARELVWARAPKGARIYVIHKLAQAKRMARRLPHRRLHGAIAAT
jgi:hypothetical protein